MVLSKYNFVSKDLHMKCQPRMGNSTHFELLKGRVVIETVLIIYDGKLLTPGETRTHDLWITCVLTSEP